MASNEPRSTMEELRQDLNEFSSNTYSNPDMLPEGNRGLFEEILLNPQAHWYYNLAIGMRPIPGTGDIYIPEFFASPGRYPKLVALGLVFVTCSNLSLAFLMAKSAEFINISWQMAFVPLYITLLTFCLICGLFNFNLRKHVFTFGAATRHRLDNFHLNKAKRVPIDFLLYFWALLIVLITFAMKLDGFFSSYKYSLVALGFLEAVSIFFQSLFLSFDRKTWPGNDPVLPKVPWAYAYKLFYTFRWALFRRSLLMLAVLKLQFNWEIGLLPFIIGSSILSLFNISDSIYWRSYVRTAKIMNVRIMTESVMNKRNLFLASSSVCFIVTLGLHYLWAVGILRPCYTLVPSIILFNLLQIVLIHMLHKHA